MVPNRRAHAHQGWAVSAEITGTVGGAFRGAGPKKMLSDLRFLMSAGFSSRRLHLPGEQRRARRREFATRKTRSYLLFEMPLPSITGLCLGTSLYFALGSLAQAPPR